MSQLSTAIYLFITLYIIMGPKKGALIPRVGTRSSRSSPAPSPHSSRAFRSCLFRSILKLLYSLSFFVEPLLHAFSLIRYVKCSNITQSIPCILYMSSSRNALVIIVQVMLLSVCVTPLASGAHNKVVATHRVRLWNT